jgi:hypothetical protein
MYINSFPKQEKSFLNSVPMILLLYLNMGRNAIETQPFNI